MKKIYFILTFCYFVSASICTPCHWDQFTVFHLVSKEFCWSRSTKDPTLFTGFLLWPCRITVFEMWLNYNWRMTRLTTNTSTLSVCTNKTMGDKSFHAVTYKMWLFETWLNCNWWMTRLSVALLTKIFQQ